jgi:hypothetical protein
VNEIGRYWPKAAATDVRRWVVANVTGGRVRNLSGRLTGAVVDAVPTSLTLATITGAVVFDGLTVRYLPKMPPVVGVAGTGSFSGRTLGFRVARGKIGGLELVRATVDIPGDRPRVAVDGALRGSLPQAVALLREPGLGLASGIGIAPADVGGTVNARVGLVVPLRGADPRALRPTVSADLHDVSVARLPRGWTLTRGDLVLDLRGTTLRGRGGGRLQDVPVTFTGGGDLSGGSRSLEIRSNVPAAAIGSFGLTQLPGVTGEIGARARYAETRRGGGTLGVDLDLARLEIDSSAPAFRKRAGARGSMTCTLALSGGAVRAVDRLDLRFGGTHVTGQATLSDGGTRWHMVDAHAVLAGPLPGEPPGRVTVRVAPERPRSRLSVTSDDLGAVLDALGTTTDMHRGHFDFAGTVDAGAPGWPLDGHVELKSFTLTRAPILARIATLGSLSGIAGALAGKKGIPFDRLSGDLAQRERVITIRSARASSRSLGIAAAGVVDAGARTLTLDGSLVPAYYGLNQAPARVPIVGSILTGKGGEGVHVIDFQVRGPLSAPSVSVRPSSAAPGAMRDLLRLLEGGPKR